MKNKPLYDALKAMNPEEQKACAKDLIRRGRQKDFVEVSCKLAAEDPSFAWTLIDIAKECSLNLDPKKNQNEIFLFGLPVRAFGLKELIPRYSA